MSRLLFLPAVIASLMTFAEPSPIVSFLIPAGKPDEEECRALVKAVNDVGFDQIILYPSTGLEYEYLGEDFFRMVGSFVDETDRRGMKMWLYDEFNWPSGTARGRVPAENEACLYRELVASTNASGEMSWQVVVSRERNIDNYCLDTNNWEPASVRRFMELTHFQYEEHFRDKMGSVIRGIFTDEPGHSSGAGRLKMPEGLVLRLPLWSGMEEEYRLASGGRDFRADAEAAIRSEEPAGAEVFRLWTELRSRRYRRTYFDPIAAWCITNGIESTGHLLCEDFPPFCARVNGLPLNTLKGLTKPGIDLIRSGTGRNFEWITLAFVQSASMTNGKCGTAELFALGPCDLTFTIMRKLYWLCALHKVDTYFQSLYHHRAYRFDVKDGYAMYSSPTQPWFKEMPLLHETAKEAAHWASKPFVCDIAVVYPQRTLGAFSIGGRGPRPLLENLCRELTWNQFTYRLVEEDERTDLPVVLDWEGASLVERRTGTRFADAYAAVAWLEKRFAARPRVKDAAGRTCPGFVTRAYCDGSAVAVDATTGEVIVSKTGILRSTQSAKAFAPATFPAPTLSLSGSSKRRLWLNPSEKLTVTTPLDGVRFVLRHRPEDHALAVTLDGHPLVFSKPCGSVAYAYDPLYVESEPLTLTAGEHVLALSGGADDKLFLPVMWLVGDFLEKERGVLSPLERQLPFGSLSSVGLSSFAGTATYRTHASFAAGERLSVDSGGAVARVRFGGRDLGARGWAPFEWEIPADLCERDLPLEIDIVTSVRPIFGNEHAPGAKLAHRLWTPPTLEDPSSVGLRAWSVVPSLGTSASDNRTAIQCAVDAASARGGGVVTIPAGEWPCGSVRLKSHVELRLEAGAVLKGSCDPQDYNADDAFAGNFFCRLEQWGGAHLLYAVNAEDVAVTGEGTIDGNGPSFFGEADEDSRFPWYKYGLKRHPFDRTWYRPGIMVGFFRTKNVRLEGVTLKHPPSWTCHFRCCDGIDVRGVTIDADRAIANSDGFSVDCSRNARFSNCTVKTGDDGFAIRASCELHAETNVCENIYLENCEIWSCCYGVRFGVGTGTIRNVEIENCRIYEAAHGFGFTPAYKLAPTKDVDIVGVRVRGCTVRDACRPVDVWVMRGARATVADIAFEDCRFASLLPSCVCGAASVPVRNFAFRRCSRFAQFWMNFRNNREWLARNDKEMRALSGTFLTTNGFAAVTVENCTPRPAGTTGVLALTFAGRDFAHWREFGRTLGRHGAHATFYLDGPIDAAAEVAARTLVDEGHSVGLCRLDSVDADKEKCFFAYLPARTFAYRADGRTPESDQMLREKGFERILEPMSADAATLLSRIDSLAAKRETAVFEASSLTPAELEAVIVRAREAGLDLLGLNEIPLL